MLIKDLMGLVCCAIVTVSCADSVIVAPVAVGAADVRSLQGDRRFPNIRDEFRRLSTEMPGFAGAFIDSSGAFTISVSTDDFPASSVDRVVSWASSFSAVGAGLAVKLKRVKYDYAALAREFAKLAALSEEGDGLVSRFIDETTGTIVIGVESLQARDHLVGKFVAAGIPSAMIVVREDSIAKTYTTLNQDYRPLVGGLQITDYASPAGSCTLGFNVMRWDEGLDPNSSPMYFLTAGHCGERWGELRGTGWRQVVNKIGQEYQVVPLRRLDPTCPLGVLVPCTAADVLVGRYDDTVSVLYGNVATVYMESWRRKQIHSHINVQGPISGALTGQTVFLVAQVTGQHNNGKILVSCEDRKFKDAGTGGDVFVLCTQQTDNVTALGDSGGPFFIPYNPSKPTQTPSVVGILIGGVSNRTWLSPISQIDAALGGAYYYW